MRKRSETNTSYLPSLFEHELATFGSFVREQRISAGLSRSLLAQRTGISLAMVEDIEHSRASATYADVGALARVFGLSERALLERVGYVGHEAARQR